MSPFRQQTVDFSDPAAVSTLNAALLVSDYGYDFSLPPGHLTPAVPGRADYLHLLADLLAEDGTGEVPLALTLTLTLTLTRCPNPNPNPNQVQRACGRCGEEPAWRIQRCATGLG